MSKGFVCLLVCTVSYLVAARGTAAQNVRWIKWVERTNDGVSIHFLGRRGIFLTHDGKTKQFLVFEGATESELASRFDTPTVRFLPATVGDTLFSMNSPEDTCNAKVKIQAGVIGVEARVGYHPPTMPAEQSEVFMAAVPSVNL